MNMRVIRHSADSEKDIYKAVLKGEGDFNIGSLVEMEITLKAKVEDILDKFPMGARFKVVLENELK